MLKISSLHISLYKYMYYLYMFMIIRVIIAQEVKASKESRRVLNRKPLSIILQVLTQLLSSEDTQEAYEQHIVSMNRVGQSNFVCVCLQVQGTQ